MYEECDPRVSTRGSQQDVHAAVQGSAGALSAQTGGFLLGVWSKDPADGQRLEGLLVLGWNPPDSRSNLFASSSMSARRSWLLIGWPAEGEAGRCLDQTRAEGVQAEVVMDVGKGIRQRGGGSTCASPIVREAENSRG